MLRIDFRKPLGVEIHTSPPDYSVVALDFSTGYPFQCIYPGLGIIYAALALFSEQKKARKKEWADSFNQASGI